MKNKSIKRNFFSKTQYVFFYIYIVFIIILSVFVGYISAMHEFFSLILYFIFIFSVTVFFIILTNPLLRALIKMNKTAEYEIFSTKIEKILKNNLDEESRNYVLMIKSNYMFAVDKEKGIELFEQVKKPIYPKYLKDYYNIKSCYHINMRQFDEAFDCIEEMKKLKVNEKIINVTKTVIKIFGTNNKIKNIEKIFPMKTGLKFTDLSNANILLYYYNSREFADEAKKYAKYILNNTKCLTEYISLANQVMEKENK